MFRGVRMAFVDACDLAGVNPDRARRALVRNQRAATEYFGVSLAAKDVAHGQ